jgi:lipopolysaccharide export system permease protein
MLLLPTFLGVILPIALFSAILFAYNKLTLDSEMVSLRSTGLGPWSLAMPAISLSAFVCVIVYAINLYFIPASYQEFKSRQFIARADFSSVLLQEGVFTNLIDDVTVYVRTRDTNGQLLGILVHDNRIDGQPITMMAESGALVKTDQGPRFVLLNGNRQEINKMSGQLSLLYFDSYALDLGHLTEDPANRWREPRERFLHELFNPSNSHDDRRNAGKFWAEAHQRIVTPFFSFALTGIALCALLGGQLNRRGQWKRILVSIFAAFIFEAIGLGLVNIVSQTPKLALLMYVNVLFAICTSVYLLNRRLRKSSAIHTPIPSNINTRE